MGSNPPVRRKLFGNRPTWAKEASTDNTPSVNQPVLFGRKPNLELLRKPESKSKPDLQEEKVEKSKQDLLPDERPAGTPKRRRISQEESIVVSSPSPDALSKLQDEEALWERCEASPEYDATDPRNHKDLTPTLTPLKNGAAVARSEDSASVQPREQKNVISIEDSDNDDYTTAPPYSPAIASASQKQEFPPAAKNHAREPDYSTPTEASVPRDSATELNVKSLSPERSFNRSFSASQTESMQDAVVKILIHSPIANTNPLIIQRKLSQRLKECRVAWCAKQGFSDDQTAEVFLTWRGRRLFDLTTCRSLGISVNEVGDAVVKGQSQVWVAQNAQIEMQAVTQAILDEEEKLKKIEEESRESGQLISASPKKDKANGIRIILRAKDYEDYKLIVRPTSTFAQILRTFRKARTIPEDKIAVLHFDGEELNEEETMSQSDIGDMETIDVYIK